MDIPLNVEVHCADGIAGHSSCIILNPATRTITHFVLRRQGILGDEELVPVTLIKESTPDLILLHCQLHELANLEHFNKGHFLGFEEDADAPDDGQISQYAKVNVMTWPYYSYSNGDPIGAYVEEEQIPANERPIHRGAQVEATDGWVGRVYEFLVKPENSAITHLVLRENHFWGDKSVTIPVAQIEQIDRDLVRLKLNREEVKKLPHIQIH